MHKQRRASRSAPAKVTRVMSRCPLCRTNSATRPKALANPTTVAPRRTALVRLSFGPRPRGSPLPPPLRQSSGEREVTEVRLGHAPCRSQARGASPYAPELTETSALCNVAPGIMTGLVFPTMGENQGSIGCDMSISPGPPWVLGLISSFWFLTASRLTSRKTDTGASISAVIGATGCPGALIILSRRLLVLVGINGAGGRIRTRFDRPPGVHRIFLSYSSASPIASLDYVESAHSLHRLALV
ncbi:hypothetical protein KM043_009384 [Ampulex compressa]|nr:hypothetical protein KM043_009384 [Ampulex compressa]